MIQIWQRNFAAIGKSEQRGGDLRWLHGRKERDFSTAEGGLFPRGVGGLFEQARGLNFGGGQRLQRGRKIH